MVVLFMCLHGWSRPRPYLYWFFLGRRGEVCSGSRKPLVTTLAVQYRDERQLKDLTYPKLQFWSWWACTLSFNSLSSLRQLW